MQMSAGLRRNSVCGPGCAASVAANGNTMYHAPTPRLSVSRLWRSRCPRLEREHPLCCRFARLALAIGFCRSQCYRRGFLGNCFSCASRNACVRSGSRLLSGSNRTIGGVASTSPSGAGWPGTGLSRQCALVFSQKICAGTLPPFAAANKEPETIALASAIPRSRSSRHRLRSVFGAHPTILAISSCRTPTPAKWRTFSRSVSLNTNAFLAMCGSRLISLLAVDALVERLARSLVDRGPPGEGLPASQDDINISRAYLETAADAAGHFGCDQARARAEKRVKDQLTGPAVVEDRTAHALDRLLRAVTPALLALSITEGVIVRDLPDC